MMNALSRCAAAWLVALLDAVFPAHAVLANDMAQAQLTGTVVYRERIALPPDAVARVTLEDVSRADAPARILAETTIRPAGQVPIPFVLDYDPAAVAQRYSYAVRAQIRSAEGRLLWTTTEHIAVLTRGNATADVQVMVHRSRARETPSGSASARPPEGLAPVPMSRTLVFECEGLELVAHTSPGEITLYLPNRTIVLPQVPAGSGAKYERDGVLFWSKGNEATLEVDGRTYRGCQRNTMREPWADAARRGVNFRAVGNEPGWHLEIEDGKRILLVTDYGQRQVSTPAPEPRIVDPVRTYHAITEAHDLLVQIEARPCQDTMSGEAFDTTVTILLDGTQYRGCGRTLGQ